MSGPDALFSLRNSFQLGAYQAAINESAVGGLSEAESVERDAIVYRSYIALGSYQLVIDEISDSAATALQAVKLLATYLKDPAANKDGVVASLEGYLSDPVIGKNATLLLVAGTVYACEHNYVDALKATHAIAGNLELMALNVQVFLKMDRVDYAEKQLKAMQAADEDATLTQLANAWVCLAMGGAKVVEATYIFQELADKFTPTVALLNGSALSQMHQGNFDDAEALLLDALNKDAKDANTLANLVVCSLHRGKPATRYLNQLRAVAPDHILAQRQITSEAAFDQAVAAYA
ncbi:hypothetical protein CLOM_g21861 [Closterium sp. NIES-68]|nr:hypothetical protein CLOM_g21861 [Closterium sp. NIES-68]GJP66492.1 hypothetical protein CLOP_g23419 [Closterium sp. NIES-67]GJP79984.1 hypothetical protein CLOP_g10210 [Closterium sp. NIES-67]